MARRDPARATQYSGQRLVLCLRAPRAGALYRAAHRGGDRCRALPYAHRRHAADCGHTPARGGVVNAMQPIVEAREVSRVFPMAAGPVTALSDVSLQIAPAEYIGIVGPSGCGKSTLLHVLGCVDVPTSGDVRIQG